MNAVDTNIIIRFLTGDDARQFKKAFSIFNSEEIFITATVVQETEWVLRFAYKFPPEAICSALEKLFGMKNVHLSSPETFAQAINWYRHGMDFSDALHLSQCQQLDKLFTFDKKLIAKAKNLTECFVTLPA